MRILLLAGVMSLALSACDDMPKAAAQPVTSPVCVPPSAEPIPPSAPPNSTWLSSDAPPVRFRSDNNAIVELHTPEEINRICAGGTPVCGRVFFACQHGNRLYMPNPCGSVDEPYAKLFCHEVAHLNGWPATHGD